MKCPKCEKNHKYKEGMTCGCGYRFALDPKEPFGITDLAFKGAVDRLSVMGEYHFTMDQLYIQIYRLIVKKHKMGLGALSCLGVIIMMFGSPVLAAALQLDWMGPAVLLGVVIIGIILIHRRPLNVPADVPLKHIRTYRTLHPIENLADGKRFQSADAGHFDEEFLNYAPERILIVDRDDTAEMLILNRFHFDQKALVVSANKYPEAAFTACKRFLSAHPDLPVYLMHDCSEEGVKMQGRLMNDPEWELENKNISNLGLHPKDVEGLKKPLWIPSRMEDISGAEKITTTGEAPEKMESGFRMPLGVAGPRIMMGTFGLAVVAGAALLSEELLALQRESDMGRGSLSGGFG